MNHAGSLRHQGTESLRGSAWLSAGPENSSFTMRKGSPGEEQEREDGDNLFQCQENQTQAYGLKERTVAWD